MPEVAEVAHVCALLRRNILHYTIDTVDCLIDPLVFTFLKGVENEAQEVEKFRNLLVNGEIVAVGRHGKYFWLRILPKDSLESIVLLMHFGMTGMIKMKDIQSHLTFMENGGDKKFLSELKEVKKEKTVEIDMSTVKKRGKNNGKEESEDTEKDNDVWPPKFVKLSMTLRQNDKTIELVFVDPRRIGRIRYLTGPEVQTDEDLLNQAPLKALGPDYSKPTEPPKQIAEFGDPDPNHHGRPILAIDQFNKLILSKKKPIKSLLLDQAYFCGVGNWVADEVIYHARLHPNEVISAKLTDLQDIHPVIQRLYESLIFVCKEAVRVEGNVSQFPDNWLMLFRWGKGRKGPKPKTKEGYDVDYVTVGGRTSCFVPKLQVLLKREGETDSPVPKKKVKKET